MTDQTVVVLGPRTGGLVAARELRPRHVPSDRDVVIDRDPTYPPCDRVGLRPARCQPRGRVRPQLPPGFADAGRNVCTLDGAAAAGRDPACFGGGQVASSPGCPSSARPRRMRRRSWPRRGCAAEWGPTRFVAEPRAGTGNARHRALLQRAGAQGLSCPIRPGSLGIQTIGTRRLRRWPPRRRSTFPRWAGRCPPRSQPTPSPNAC